MITFEEFIQQNHPEMTEIFSLFKKKSAHEEITGRKPVTRTSMIRDKRGEWADEKAAQDTEKSKEKWKLQ